MRVNCAGTPGTWASSRSSSRMGSPPPSMSDQGSPHQSVIKTSYRATKQELWFQLFCPFRHEISANVFNGVFLFLFFLDFLGGLQPGLAFSFLSFWVGPGPPLFLFGWAWPSHPPLLGWAWPSPPPVLVGRQDDGIDVA